MDERIRKFYDNGFAHIRAAREMYGADPCIAIRPGEHLWQEWEQYFRWLGAEPRAMNMARSGQIRSVTMPTESPALFDRRYAEQELRA